MAPMTVSRTINGFRHIRPETASKVRAAIDRLSYSPNQAARLLMGQRSNSIGLVIPDLKNPFFAVVADGVQATARKRGSLVWVVASNADVRIEQQEIEKMLSYQVDGILLIPSDPGHSFLRHLLAKNVPVVAIDLPIEAAAADSVEVENRQSSQKAVEHLIEHGYKNIACLGGWHELFTMRERIGGYETAMRHANLPPRVQPATHDMASMRRILDRLWRAKNPPEAIFTLNQLTTEMVLEILDCMQISIPSQVAIIGFDDFHLASLLKPKLTVVRQPAAEIGHCATRLLFDRLDSKGKSSKIRTVLPSELIIRESCGCNTLTTSRVAIDKRLAAVNPQQPQPARDDD